MTPEFEILLVVTIPDHPPRAYRFEGNRILIGRSKNNYLTLDENAISKVHCELVNDTKSEQWIFRDLGSTNGSTLNGKTVGWDVIPVNDGDEIILGNVIKLLFLKIHDREMPEFQEEDEDEDPEVNPVAAAVARQSRDGMESTQLIKLKHVPKKK